ncbi:winged helix-turn-helix domain-containing protein [Pseudoalteromonas luteoviolacea]|uniref:winged helix-turn-helix domain-containing protein n=1 Tax=Pseudoalteromonas luteoviolacea TaxID=43657 RepID=UPI001EED1439|nr:winged helix-turn-helix domain-containing protein [Pseudoalteromonas luteoviolacea]MCF6442275.1 winged helix-turn-helix domain-containing protein [Pseudoalteromonas luteoviolacea]
MHWQIGEIKFCDKTLTISFDDKEIQLEPMVSEVLRFFCLNPQILVSRDELIEQVWQGRIVTDNAVNRVITKLRKALNDDPRKPFFIVTYPKKGYQFIAPVRILEDKPSPQFHARNISSHIEKNNHMSVLTPSIVAIFVLITIYLLLQNNSKSAAELLTSVNALTREPGLELNPHISPDGNYLLFTEVHNGNISLKLKTLDTEGVEIIDHGLDSWEGPGAWRKDGKAFVYLTTTSNSCQYFMRSFENGKFSKPELIHNCHTGSYGKIIFTHDNDLLVFNEAKYPGGPFYLYSLQLSSGKITRLEQPKIGLGGYSQFDLHPTENQLLISAVDKQLSTGLYVIDIEHNRFDHLFDNEGGAVWDHSGDRIVLLGGYPANEIVSYDLTGQDRAVLYSNSHSLFGLSRHSNGKGYLFSTGARDRNITYYSMTDLVEQTVAATSVDERLARFSPGSQTIAYISLATGSEQIWLYDFNSHLKTVLSKFDEEQYFIDLKWSFDGQDLFALTHNALFKVSVNSGLVKQLKIPHAEISGLSIKDEQTIAFSLKGADKWRVHYYDLRNDKLSSADPKWQFVSYSKYSEDIIWQDIHGAYFTGLDFSPVVSKKINTIPFVVQSRFNLQKKANEWLWQRAKSRRYQLFQYNDITNQQKLLITSDTSDFDWHSNLLLYNSIHYANSDIYSVLPK